MYVELCNVEKVYSQLLENLMLVSLHHPGCWFQYFFWELLYCNFLYCAVYFRSGLPMWLPKPHHLIFKLLAQVLCRMPSLLPPSHFSRLGTGWVLYMDPLLPKGSTMAGIEPPTLQTTSQSLNHLSRHRHKNIKQFIFKIILFYFQTSHESISQYH